jgi:hypothetical protein
MKSPLLVVLAVLQLATLGVVVALLVERNESVRRSDLDTLRDGLAAALSQERTIIVNLDRIRAEAAAASRRPEPAAPTGPTASSPTEAGSTPPSAVSSDPPPPKSDPAPAVASSPFPEAAAALAALKRAEQNRREEIRRQGQNVRPLDVEVEQRKSALLARGHEAVYVVKNEVDLQPYEKSRDPKFVEYLLNDVVPSLSGAASEEAFTIARSALVRATNEGPIKVAAARALRSVDSQRWVKDVCDVIASGERNTTVREQLLGMFAETPKPEAVELCKRSVEDAREDPALRVRAIEVLEKQDSSAVNPCLNRVLFDEPAPILKNHALQSLCARLTDLAEKRTLLQKVIDANPAQMPDSVREKAQKILETLK